MEKSRQFSDRLNSTDFENKILRRGGDSFKAAGHRLLYGGVQTWEMPDGTLSDVKQIHAVDKDENVIGSIQMSKDHTGIAVHPDHIGTSVGPVLMAAANRISRRETGKPLAGDRETTPESFRIIQKYFPSDSTKITHRSPTKPYSAGVIKQSLMLDQMNLPRSGPWHSGGVLLEACHTCGGSGAKNPASLPLWASRPLSDFMISAETPLCNDCDGTGTEKLGRTIEGLVGLV